MTVENGGEGDRRTAEDLFAEFLLRREAEGIEIEDFAGRHPRHAEALRALYSIHGERRGADPDEGDPAASGSLDPVLAHFGGGTPEEPSPAFRDRIDGYKILSVLGEGGFGIVYRAEQERPIRRTVAVKVIKLGMDSREVVARFDAEKQALALMNHPSIARIHDAGLTDTGRPFFTMEYIAGVPITDYAARHGLGVRERLDLFIPVCEAVGHAHQKAVIHRDIKPSNVLVTIDGGRPLPKIIDFGVSKALSRRLSDGTFFTEMGQLIGTPAYMSPEQ
ncbi:MAG: serine/threonine protein kinase, partial [Planctomycetes bacterium]|nr:serine/threonine protein kinase [Planctomycetota bacterium]